MDEKSVRSEMHKIAQGRIDAGLTTGLDALIHGVLNSRADIDGDDAAFYRVHTFQDLKRIAKSVVGKYNTADVTTEELLFPGFLHLCKAYPMMRDGSIVIVPVDQCTDEELAGRAAQLDDMAKGCIKHAREIRDFVMARGRVAA